MRIRTQSELNDYLDRQISWRKRELTTLKAMIDKSRPHERGILIRSAVCILYAHWEGFVSESANAYVNFVSLQGLKLRDLTPNFIALGLRADIQEAGRSNKATLHLRLTEKILFEMREPFRANWENAISAQSNLNANILHEVLSTIGIDSGSYMAKRPIINQRLVDNRNIIAHGGRPEMDLDEYEILHSDVLQLIEWIRTDIENAAALDRYKRNSQYVV